MNILLKRGHTQMLIFDIVDPGSSTIGWWGGEGSLSVKYLLTCLCIHDFL